MNLARLNHILIPTTKAQRDRLRRTRTGRAVQWLFRSWLAFTDEGRFLMVFWLICGAAGLEVNRNQIYLLWSALTGLVVASLVLRPLYRLRDATVAVEPPDRITVGDTGTIAVTVRNHADAPLRGLRVERPLLPWDGRWTGPAPAIAEAKRGEVARALIGARFSQRGEHHLDPFHVARVLPFSLTQGPALPTSGARFLVVPRVADVRSLALPTSVRYQPGGVNIASHVGESVEFVGLRPYRPGDRVRDLHARSWARLGEPVVREYQQEYFTRVGVVLDTDATVPEDRREAAISLAAGVLAHLTGGEALIDLLVVGHQVHRLTMGRHVGTLEQALDLLACVEPGDPPDPGAMTEALAPHLQRLSAVVLVLVGWDAERASIAQRVRARGSACRSLVVAEASPGPDATAVDPARISAGEALWL